MVCGQELVAVVDLVEPVVLVKVVAIVPPEEQLETAALNRLVLAVLVEIWITVEAMGPVNLRNLPRNPGVGLRSRRAVRCLCVGCCWGFGNCWSSLLEEDRRP